MPLPPEELVVSRDGENLPLPLGELGVSRDGENLPLPLGELGVSRDGENLPLPLGEVAEQSEDGEGTMTIPKDNNQLENARRLRRDMTPHERKLWYLFLRKYPVKVYKQRIIGRYIVDFYCARAKLVIELDGSQHYEMQAITYDAERSLYFESLGLKVLRFFNRDVDQNFSVVCEQIDIAVKDRI